VRYLSDLLSLALRTSAATFRQDNLRRSEVLLAITCFASLLYGFFLGLRKGTRSSFRIKRAG
jgi:hypothetical protein